MRLTFVAGQNLRYVVPPGIGLALVSVAACYRLNDYFRMRLCWIDEGIWSKQLNTLITRVEAETDSRNFGCTKDTKLQGVGSLGWFGWM